MVVAVREEIDLRSELGAVLLATVGQSAWVRAAEQGHPPAWGNRSAGSDLAEQVDPEFVPSS